MIRTSLDQNDILRKVIFTLTVSTSNPETLDALNIFGYPMGLNVESIAVNNLQCIIIDQTLFDKLDLIPFLDANGQQETVELYDENDKIIGRFKAFEILVHYFENGYIEIRKTMCVAYDIFNNYEVNVLFGLGARLVPIL